LVQFALACIGLFLQIKKRLGRRFLAAQLAQFGGGLLRTGAKLTAQRFAQPLELGSQFLDAFLGLPRVSGDPDANFFVCHNQNTMKSTGKSASLLPAITVIAPVAFVYCVAAGHPLTALTALACFIVAPVLWLSAAILKRL
jgi:hypothetical protein